MMKTREQVYGREAAAILRDISMYRVLTAEQILRLHPGKDAKERNKIRNLLTYLVKQLRYGCWRTLRMKWSIIPLAISRPKLSFSPAVKSTRSSTPPRAKKF